jgi:hypothetical protein
MGDVGMGDVGMVRRSNSADGTVSYGVRKADHNSERRRLKSIKSKKIEWHQYYVSLFYS